MITEMRLLIFGEADLLALFQNCARQGDVGLPVGAVLWAEVRVMPVLGIELIYADARANHLVLPEQAVAAMVLHAGRLGIPLPNRGEKSLDVRGRQVALKMSFPALPALVAEAVQPA